MTCTRYEFRNGERVTHIIEPAHLVHTVDIEFGRWMFGQTRELERAATPLFAPDPAYLHSLALGHAVANGAPIAAEDKERAKAEYSMLRELWLNAVIYFPEDAAAIRAVKHSYASLRHGARKAIQIVLARNTSGELHARCLGPFYDWCDRCLMEWALEEPSGDDPNDL